MITNGRPRGSRWLRTPEALSLGALLVFTLTAIAGYGVFALHPQLIPDSDSARAFFGQSFELFARAHILVAAVVLAVPLIRRAGFRWIPAFALVAVVSFLSEFIGTGYGFPFGGYEYTHLLGYKLGGRVPFVIPISWFLMALPSWILATRAFPGNGKALARVFLGAYLLTAWDLALDPAMSYLTPYWVWENPGPFFGMPWVNLAGWMGTGVVLMVIFETVGAARWTDGLSTRWMASYYGIVLLMPVGMLAAAGVWVPLAATGLALGLAFTLSRAARASGRHSRPGLFPQRSTAP